ncbi:MAG: hypothetical protein ACJ788_16075 [Ktedonobacteraceae bacterium]
MQEAGEDWEEVVSPEDMPILIETFVEKVVLTNLSPRFYKVTIYWRDPEWQIHSAVCFRWTVPSPNWTDEEKAIIEAYGATASRKELIELMPNRSWKGIRKYLNRHIAKNVDRRRTELKRDKRSFEEEGLIHDLCIRDLEVMRQYSIEYEEIKSIEKKYNETGENFAKWS